MRRSILLFLILPFILWANDKTPSTLTKVVVYLTSAEVHRNVSYQLKEGYNEILLSNLSHKIDENSIQVSGLNTATIQSLSYDLDYLAPSEGNPEAIGLENRIKSLELDINRLKNLILGLNEEEKVLTTNRLVSSDVQQFDLERVKAASAYYRNRIAAIKNEVYDTNLKINELNQEMKKIQGQLGELSALPENPIGTVILKLHSPIAQIVNLKLSYQVTDAGWVPTYDISSKSSNDPLKLIYKAHVYQRTGVDWRKANIALSTGNPNVNLTKPNLGTKYLNFVSRYANRPSTTVKKQRYQYNPAVRKVTGVVTDESGTPLPGCNVLIKGTSKGTTTDFDGYFELNVANGQELAFSYIGFESMEMPIYSSVMNISLEEDAQALEEVVVVGYGSQTKRDITSAVSTVLQGRAAGVEINDVNSHRSYQKPTLPPPPLYVIDGVPMPDFSEGDLDESEIQSVEVLKGNSATTIYGSQAANGVILITTWKSHEKEGVNSTLFEISKSYTIPSGDEMTSIEINTFKLDAKYEYLAAPVVNENVFLTAKFKNWEQYNLLPGEASIYFAGHFAGKTSLDPYTTKKEIVISMGLEPDITVERKRANDFKAKNFTGNNRIVNRTYELEVKNNKKTAITLRLLDRIPISQNKEIKVDDIVAQNAEHDTKKGILTWVLDLYAQQVQKESFSFQVKYPKYKNISI